MTLLTTKSCDVDGEYTLFTFPKEARYITEELMPDLPHDAYIDKGITGCGGTTLALTNKVPYVIAVPMKNLIKNKSYQHKDMLAVYGETTREDIDVYLAKNLEHPKIMVTFDSLEKVTDCINPSDYRLLIDEAQTLVQYAGTFKAEVCNRVMNNTYKFKSVSYITATPTKRKYLPDEIKKLDYCKFKWLGATKPNIQTYNIKGDFTKKVVTSILDVYDNSSDDIYVFYNSLTGVVSSIKLLLKAIPTLDKSDINLMFSDNPENRKFFESKLSGMSLEYNPNSNKRINFLSSMAFQGIDIYTKNNVTSIIVADPKKRSMRYDIHIDLPQIVGRFRADKDSGFIPNNNIIFLWTTFEYGEIVTEDEYKSSIVDDQIKRIKEYISQYKESYSAKEGLYMYSIVHNSPNLICTNPSEKRVVEREYVFNPLGESSMMSVFSSMYLDFTTFNNVDSDGEILKNSRIGAAIAECFSNVNTYEFPKLSAKFKLALDKSISFTATAREYHSLIKTSEDEIEPNKKNALLMEAAEILELDDDLKKYVSVMGYSRLSSHSFVKSKLEKEYQDVYIFEEKKHELLKFIDLSIGSIYSRDNIITKLENTFSEFDITSSPKVSFLNKLYDYKPSTLWENNKSVNAIKILSLK